MGGRAQLIEKSIAELILQHFDNESISQLLAKAPLKQGMSILPAGSSNIARKKAIQNLVANKNLKYIINILESGQFNIFVQENYENLPKKKSLDEFKLQLTRTNGSALDYLLYLISVDNIDSLVALFNDNSVEVKQFSSFLESEGFGDFIFHRPIQQQSEPDNSDVIKLASQINKLQNDNQRLQKKMDREVSKLERDSENQLVLLKKEQLAENERITKVYESEIAKLKSELTTNQRELKKQITINEKLEKSVFKLKSDVETQRSLKNPSVLVVGNLPEESIIDSQQYQISSIANLDQNGDDILLEKSNWIKVYVQSEYVSTEKYLEFRKKYPKIPMSYLSREQMKKGE